MEENKNLSADQAGKLPDLPPENSSERIPISIGTSEENVLPEPEVATTETTYPSQTKEMEVHHHSHPGHHKKKWTDYFWEFLMLFLAVSLGFYAENMRESMLHQKEVKTHLNSLVADLQTDILLFDSVIDRNTYSALMADSLIKYYIQILQIPPLLILLQEVLPQIMVMPIPIQNLLTS